MAVDVIAGRRAQKDGGTCQIGRLSPAASGDALQDRAVALRIVAKGGCVVRGHVTRSDGVHVNPLGGPFIRKRPGELHDSTFASAYAGTRIPPWKERTEAIFKIFPP